jgi:hypothetical protein
VQLARENLTIHRACSLALNLLGMFQRSSLQSHPRVTSQSATMEYAPGVDAKVAPVHR